MYRFDVSAVVILINVENCLDYLIVASAEQEVLGSIPRSAKRCFWVTYFLSDFFGSSQTLVLCLVDSNRLLPSIICDVMAKL